ncbi:MAG: glycosyltransferase family 39 protein [Candidatus Omnitrophota bacterium]
MRNFADFKINGFYLKHPSIVAFIVFIGGLLRIFQLASKSIWYDEARSISFAQKQWVMILYDHYLMRPVYFLGLKLWTTYFGYQELAVRSLSVIFGIVSIYILYKIGKLLFDKKVATLAAFLLSLSTYHVVRCQQARGYALSMLLVLLSLYFFWKILKNFNTKNYVFFAIGMLTIFYTNFLAAIIMSIIYNVFYLAYKAKMKKWLISQVLIILFASLLIIPAIKYYHIEVEHDKNCPAENRNILSSIIEDFSYGKYLSQGGNGRYRDPHRPWASKGLFYLFISIVIYVSFKIYFMLIRSKKKRYKISAEVIFITIWFIVTLVGFFIINRFIPIGRWSKTAIIVLPAFYLSISLCIRQLSRVFRALSIILIVLFSVVSLFSFYYPSDNKSWREIAELIKSNIKEGDVLIFAPSLQLVPFRYYYEYNMQRQLAAIKYGDSDSGILTKNNRQTDFYNECNLVVGIKFNELENFIKKKSVFKYKKNNFWLIISPGWFTRSDTDLLLKHMGSYCSLKYKQSYPWEGVDIYYYAIKDGQ